MRILLSAYDCVPDAGSESGVGWHWAVELARNHEVTVLTREANRPSIEKAAGRLPNTLRFAYFDNAVRERQLARVPFIRYARPYLYYRAWQHDVLPFAQSLHHENMFDLVQHITWGAWRQPSHLHRLGIPLIFGPVGGGERTPPLLRRSLTLRGQAREILRDIGNRAHLLFPSLWECFDRSLLVICRTEGTQAYIPKRYWHKTRIHREIGIDAHRVQSTPAQRVDPRKLRLLFVGRFLGWKGIHLALRSVAEFTRKHPQGAVFDIVGGRCAPDELASLTEQIHRAGLGNLVRTHGWMPHDEAQALYKSYDAFLFPSFRDSGGTVVLESLASGLPVICLDLGGPPHLLAGQGGLVIRTSNQSTAKVVESLAGALEALYQSPELVVRLKHAALIRARQVTWESTVASVYAMVESAMTQRTTE